ncbi:MAG TPA: ribonuclease Y [Planctomycetota bacterium]|nr:ribonuclease Y [Planctomycetota bacterium]
MIAALWAAFGAFLASAVLVPVFNVWARRRDQEAAARAADERDAALVKERERIEKEAQLSARDELSKQREQALTEESKWRDELRGREARLVSREDSLERRFEEVGGRERAVTAREAALSEARSTLEARAAEVEGEKKAAARALEKVAALTREEARTQLLEKLQKEGDQAVEDAVKRLQTRAQSRIDEEARSLLVAAIERAPASHAGDTLVTTVSLPTDEAKMRIVGREGRNVRALEEATGVDILIDDTPGVVVVSAFDPVRREVARRALERLLQDGRIHPVAVEHAVQAAREELESLIPRLGEDAARDAAVEGLTPNVLAAMGRLEFRSSYGQNVRRHALESARVAAALAGELRLDVRLARRAALLHDIGKALSVDEVDGGHARAGADFLRREGEVEAVVHAVSTHHDDGEVTALAALVRIADEVSADRPGARDEQIGLAVKRYEELETIASGFPGVVKAYAVQAGREVRVLVDPGGVSDKAAGRLAREISKALDQKVSSPGEVVVTVVRDLRVSETVK